MRKLQIYVDKYGAETGRKLFHALQSQAAHAGVSARLRRKIRELTGEASPRRPLGGDSMPLFPEEPHRPRSLHSTGAIAAVRLADAMPPGENEIVEANS